MHIRNRLFTSASSIEKTPYEILLNKCPDITYIRGFGSRAYVHIPKKDRKWKLNKRAHAGFLVGFERGNSYRVYLPDNAKVVVSRDVIVNENWTHPENSDSFSRDTTEHSVEFDDPFRGASYLHGDSVADTSQTSVIDGELEHHEE